MYSSILVIVMAIACVSSAPLDTPAEVISAPFTNPTVLAVQNSQIFLRNYKAIPSRVVSQAAFTLPNGLQTIAPVVTDGITRLRPVGSSFEKIETPVAVAAPLKTTEPEVVAAPVDSNLVETLPAVAAPLSLPIAKSAVAAPLAVPVAKAVAAPLTSAVGVPLSAPLVNNAPLVSSPYVASPYVSSPYVASPYVASPYVASPYVASPYISSPYIASPYISQYITQTVF